MSFPCRSHSTPLLEQDTFPAQFMTHHGCDPLVMPSNDTASLGSALPPTTRQQRKWFQCVLGRHPGMGLLFPFLPLEGSLYLGSCYP